MRVYSANIEQPSIREKKGHTSYTASIMSIMHMYRCLDNLLVKLLRFYYHQWTWHRVF